MALMAVTCTSAGRQSWKERSLFDVTVISSFVTEFIFISQSEAGLNFLIWREVPSILLTSTLHDTTEKKQYRKILAFHFFWSYFLILSHTNVWARAFQLKTPFITNVSNRNFNFGLTDRAEHDFPDSWRKYWLVICLWCHSWLSDEAISELP